MYSHKILLNICIKKFQLEITFQNLIHEEVIVQNSFKNNVTVDC